MKEELLKEEVALMDKVTAELHGSVLTVNGPKGQVSKEFLHRMVRISVEKNKIVITAPQATKREKTMVGSFYSHIKNMVQGVVEPYVYKLQICSGHFPMSVSVSGDELIIKNFLGEVVPRKVALPKGAEVKVTGTEITVTSPDKEIAGQTAAKIESLCRITNRDRRVFQDGCYITQKAGNNLV